MHTVITAFIDYDCASLLGPRNQFSGHFVWRTCDDEVDPIECCGAEFDNRVVSTVKGDGSAGRSC